MSECRAVPISTIRLHGSNLIDTSIATIRQSKDLIAKTKEMLSQAKRLRAHHPLVLVAAPVQNGLVREPAFPHCGIDVLKGPAANPIAN